MTGKTITATTYSTTDCSGPLSRVLTFTSGACGASQYYGFGQEIVTYVAPASTTPVPTVALTLAPTATRSPTATLTLAPTATRSPTAALTLATTLKPTQAPSTEPTMVVLYFVTKKYSDSACSVLKTGTSTRLGACLPALADFGYTRTTSSANYATIIAYSDSACTAATSTAKTTFLSDICAFDASSGYTKSTVTATPTFASSSEGAIVR